MGGEEGGVRRGWERSGEGEKGAIHKTHQSVSIQFTSMHSTTQLWHLVGNLVSMALVTQYCL